MGGPLRRRIDHQHAALTAATHRRGRRFGRVVIRPEAVVRLRRLQVVEIDAEPLALERRDGVAQEVIVDGAGWQLHQRDEPAQRA